MITIATEDWTCEVLPEIGGAIGSLRHRGQDVLRPALPDPEVVETACFPLVPFGNRIAEGRLPFGGETVQLAADPEGAPHALHGHGWRRPWRVDAQCPRGVRLALKVDREDGWPWQYEAMQTLHLVGDGLDIVLSVTNLATDKEMPVGTGIHPYFARTRHSAIACSTEQMWCNDATGLATHPAAETRFAERVLVPVAELEGSDNFFVTKGPVRIVTEAGVVDLGGDRTLGHHIYAPPGKPFFCVEPMSHVPNAFGRAEYGAADLLQPGEERSWRYWVRLLPPEG